MSKVEHDYKYIYSQYCQGFTIKDLSEKYQISYDAIFAMMQKFKKNPNYVPYQKKRQNQFVIANKDVKIKPLKKLNPRCPIMQKIEVLGLFNKKKATAEIASELSLEIKKVEEIINKALKGFKNV